MTTEESYEAGRDSALSMIESLAATETEPGAALVGAMSTLFQCVIDTAPSRQDMLRAIAESILFAVRETK